jgi:hypothetical protein
MQYLHDNFKMHIVCESKVQYHYYQNGVQFTSLNHYGTLKVK